MPKLPARVVSLDPDDLRVIRARIDTAADAGEPYLIDGALDLPSTVAVEQLHQRGASFQPLVADNDALRRHVEGSLGRISSKLALIPWAEGAVILLPLVAAKRRLRIPLSGAEIEELKAIRVLERLSGARQALEHHAQEELLSIERDLATVGRAEERQRTILRRLLSKPEDHVFSEKELARALVDHAGHQEISHIRDQHAKLRQRIQGAERKVGEVQSSIDRLEAARREGSIDSIEKAVESETPVSAMKDPDEWLDGVGVVVTMETRSPPAPDAVSRVGRVRRPMLALAIVIIGVAVFVLAHRLLVEGKHEERTPGRRGWNVPYREMSSRERFDLVEKVFANEDLALGECMHGNVQFVKDRELTEKLSVADAKVLAFRAEGFAPGQVFLLAKPKDGSGDFQDGSTPNPTSTRLLDECLLTFKPARAMDRRERFDRVNAMFAGREAVGGECFCGKVRFIKDHALDDRIKDKEANVLQVRAEGLVQEDQVFVLVRPTDERDDRDATLNVELFHLLDACVLTFRETP